jgi:hypothetical protein
MENVVDVTLQLVRTETVDGKTKEIRTQYKGINPAAEDTAMIEAGKALGSLMFNAPEEFYAVKRLHLDIV